MSHRSDTPDPAPAIPSPTLDPRDVFLDACEVMRRYTAPPPVTTHPPGARARRLELTDAITHQPQSHADDMRL